MKLDAGNSIVFRTKGFELNSILLKPTTISEAVSMLATEEDASPIAGGATLVAMMNADLIAPQTLIALDGIPGLKGISQAADGSLRVGAMTLHRETAGDPRMTGSLRVVAEAASVIANPIVRNMGTMGGSIAFFDPAADYPAALVATRAEVELEGPDGARRLPAAEFFVDWYTTAREEGELVTAIHFPAPVDGVSTYRKIARTAGDFAIASCAACLDPDGSVRVAVGACGPVPLSDVDAEAALAGHLDDPAAMEAFTERLVGLADPVSDVRGSAEYRLRLIPRLIRSTLEDLATVNTEEAA